MKFSADDYRLYYADLSDAELLALRRDELAAVARPCYDREMSRRGMYVASPESAPAPESESEETVMPAAEPEGVRDGDAEEREEEELAPAAIFRNRRDAAGAREKLQSAYIPTFLENDEMAAEWTPRSQAGSFRLLVPASYLAQAREVLS